MTEACGKSSTSPTPPPADVPATIQTNHNHSGLITAAQITAGSALTLNIRGTAAHPHTVEVTQSDLTALRNRQSVTKDSSTDPSNTFGNHAHVVVFTPA